MAPTNRRSTRSSPGSSSKSPSKKSPSTSPKKGTRPTRMDKSQPRIDEYKPASKTAPTRRAKKIEEEEEDEVVEIAQVKSVNIGIDKKAAYEITPISSTTSSPITPKTRTSPASSSSSSSVASSYLSGSWSRGQAGYAMKELGVDHLFSQQSSSSASASSSTASSPVACKASFDKFSKSEQEDNQLLRSFDIDCVYGPCCGISRRERYERAIKYSLDPPPSPIILQILDKRMAENEKYYQEKWETW
jgi:hypothetical protein